MKLVECVPNFSEGRRPEVINAIRDAIAAVDGVSMLDVSSDESHNRSVVTFVAPIESVVDAAFAGISKARELIDLNKHTGEHPRIGATDVVPFIPMEGTTMEECIALARTLGQRVGDELEIPVYLYERAALRPERRNLAAIRKGGFEGLREAMLVDPSRSPDFGPPAMHSTFGAVAIGARPVLVAYNIYLGGEENLPLAKRIGSSIRESSGGLPAVKSMGLLVDGQAQVSMNLVDIDTTSMHTVFDTVAAAAREEGVAVTWSEIVGLVPERSLVAAGREHLMLKQFSDAQILERRVRESLTHGQSVDEFVAALGSSAPTPGGGTASAHSGAVAASLVQMVANLTIGKKKYADVASEMASVAKEAEALTRSLLVMGDEDAASYDGVSRAYKLPREGDGAAEARARAIDEALLHASQVPLRAAESCVRVAELAAFVAVHGNSNAVSDAGVAALLAEAACRGACYNVAINVSSLGQMADRGRELMQTANSYRSLVAKHAAEATAAVEKALGQS